MKRIHILSAATAFIATGPMLDASTVTRADPSPEGIGYRYTMILGEVDTASVSHHVSGWSWEDQTLFGNTSQGQTTEPLGWTHNSNWVALTVEVATIATFRLESKADVPNGSPANPGQLAGGSLIPGMTIWSGLENDGENFHTYNNRGNIAWAEDIQYITHLEPNGTSVVTATMAMQPGDYTLVLGGNGVEDNNGVRQGYLATVSSVPEPASALLVALGALGMLAGRRGRPRPIATVAASV